jgi:spermidine synthase
MTKASTRPARLPEVAISESDGFRALHLDGDAIQSAMLLADPDVLALEYTQAMMAFALFKPDPRDVLMVGLGGGSVAKFIHQRMPTTHVTAVELNPQVVAAAREYFGLPPDDARLQVLVGDGARYVPAQPASADVVLVDGFDDGAVVRSLCTQSFYDACAMALRPGGVLVANFIIEEPRLGEYFARIETAFGGRMLVLPAADRVNMIALAVKDGARRYAIAGLRKSARALKRCLGLPYPAFLRDLIAFNASSASFLHCRRPVPPQAQARGRRSRLLKTD